jgi:hypothetical protein
VSNAGALPNASYDFAQYANVRGRLFLFGRDPDYHRGAGDQHTRELEVKEEPVPGPAAGGDVYNITNIIDNDFGITINNVTSSVTVKHVENNTTVNNISIRHDELNQDVTVLPFATLGQNVGFFDGDFFLRTHSGDADLLRVDTDSDGVRHFIGQRQTGRSPAPKSARLALFRPGADGGAGTLLRFQTDRNGEFRVPLPADARGPAYVFGIDGTAATGAASVDLG